MTTQRIEIDISSDIFDNVMFFLENLPKNKITLTFDTPPQEEKIDNIFSQTAGLLSSQDIDPIKWQNQIRREWDGA